MTAPNVTSYVDYLEALLAVQQAAMAATFPDPNPVRVYDGQPVSDDDQDFVAIGYDETLDDDLTASGHSGWRSLSRRLEGEFAIPCEVSCNIGDLDFTATRRRARDVVNAFWNAMMPTGATIRGNATALSVASVQSAHLDDFRLYVRKDGSQGIGIVFVFAVVVKEFPDT